MREEKQVWVKVKFCVLGWDVRKTAWWFSEGLCQTAKGGGRVPLACFRLGCPATIAPLLHLASNLAKPIVKI